MSVSVKSLAHPNTKLVPLTGGTVIFKGTRSLVGSTYDDDFVLSNDPTVWTERAGTTNVTVTPGAAPNGRETWVVTAGGAAQLYLDGDNTVTGPVTVQFGHQIIGTPTYAAGTSETFYFETQSGGAEKLEISVQPVSSGGPTIDQIVITYRDNTMGADATVTIRDIDAENAWMRAVFADGKFTLWDEFTKRPIASFSFVLSWTPAFNIGTTAPVGSSFTVRPRKFRHIPTVTTLPDVRDGGVPYVESHNLQRLYVNWVPGFPGTFRATVNGSGAVSGTSLQASSSQALTGTMGERDNDSIQFMASNIETLYDDFGGVIACRNFAPPDDANVKDMIVPMQCFDDGSVQDSTAVDIVTLNSGQTETSTWRARAKFYIEDENAAKWGASTRFDRIAYGDSTDFDSPNTKVFGYTRVLYLSNGDRVYYGHIDDVVSVGFYVELVNDPGAGNWEINKIGPDGTETLQNTGAFGANFTVAGYGPGRYVLRGTASELFSANIRLGSLISDPIWESSESSEPTAGHDVLELHFTVYDHEGQLFVNYHDVSANTLTMYVNAAQDVSTRNHSISAVEKDDGKVVVFFDYAPDGAEFGSLNRRIYFRTFNPVTPGWDAGLNYLELPKDIDTDAVYHQGAETYWVWAFDVVKTEDVFNIMFSARIPVESVRVKKDAGGTISVAAQTSPVIANALYAISISTEAFSMDADYVATEVEATRIACISHDTLFSFRDPLYSGTAPNYTVNPCQIDYVKAEYDSDMGLVCVTTIDYYHRLPVIWAGRDDSFKEIAVPWVFETTQYLFEDNNPPITGFSYFGVETAHAAFGYDGMVYCVATRWDQQDSTVHMAVVDPGLYFTNLRDAYVMRPELWRAPTYGIQQFSIYKPKYRTQVFPVFSNYGQTALGARSASISRCNQHLVGALGGDEYDNHFIFQNIEYDNWPFETSEEDVWIPEMSTPATGGWSVTGAGTDNQRFFTLAVAGNQVVKTLTGATVRSNRQNAQEIAADIGYKWHCRAEFGTSAAPPVVDGLPADTMIVRAKIVYEDSLTNRWKATARLIVDSLDLRAEIFNPYTATWDIVYTWSNYLAAFEIVDYYILGRITDDVPNSDPKCLFQFSWKRRSKNVANHSIPEFYEDYRQEASVVSGQGFCETAPAETTVFDITGGAGAGTEIVNLYQAGWNVLDVDDGLLIENPKGAGDFVTVTSSLPGEDWWRMNDRLLLLKSLDDDPPAGLIPSAEHTIERVTPSIHWPNGFKYRFSGPWTAISDRWELGREVIQNTATLLSSRLHGIWWTVTDGTDVYIWADAVDSDLREFYVNCFMVRGYNARELTLVAKDNLIDPWIEIAKLDLKHYALSGVAHAAISGVDVLEVANATFENGEFHKSVPMRYEEAGLADVRVLDSNVDEVYLNSDLARVATEGVIFGDTGVKVLDTPIQYRFVGFKIASRSTEEGHFLARTVDFGYATNLPPGCGHAEGGGRATNFSNVVRVGPDEQPFALRSVPGSNEFELEYKLPDALSYAKLMALVDKISHSSKPLWIFQRYDDRPDRVWLCLVAGSVNHGLIRDEEDEEYYSLTLKLEQV